MVEIWDEEIGQEIVNEWFLRQMTDNTPPTAKDLYLKLHEALAYVDDDQ
jgi:hypothetical protein